MSIYPELRCLRSSLVAHLGARRKRALAITWPAAKWRHRQSRARAPFYYESNLVGLPADWLAG